MTLLTVNDSRSLRNFNSHFTNSTEYRRSVSFCYCYVCVAIFSLHHSVVFSHHQCTRSNQNNFGIHVLGIGECKSCYFLDILPGLYVLFWPVCIRALRHRSVIVVAKIEAEPYKPNGWGVLTDSIPFIDNLQAHFQICKHFVILSLLLNCTLQSSSSTT